MSLPSELSGPLVELGIEAGMALGKRLIEAISSGDRDEWEPLIDILPEELKTRATMIAEREETRRQLELELEK